MKKTSILLVITGFLFFGLSAGCGSSGADKAPVEEEVAPPKREDYVGTYDILETKYDKTFEVYIEHDTLFYFSEDIGSSVMYPEDNEVFDVPGHNTRVRFMRNKSKEVDRAIFVTKKGRYTGVKIHPDSLTTTPQ